VHCCGGKRSVYCFGGAKDSQEGNGKKEKNGDAAAALLHAVAPVGAPSVCTCGGAKERKGCESDAASTLAHAVAPVGMPSAAAARLYGE
jgi:hypothetical protein